MQLIRFLTILYISQVLLMGGVTGKVSGRVIDSNTNEALIGANVMLVGTSLGAATDEDGYYHILNVTPGFYDLRANMIGYAEKTITGIRVEIDLTAVIDLDLSIKAIEGEMITVAEQIRRSNEYIYRGDERDDN